VAFVDAGSAVAAAGEVQAVLAGGPVQVRIGIHTGEAVVTDESYVGLDEFGYAFDEATRRCSDPFPSRPPRVSAPSASRAFAASVQR
jgi:hypothetical protein